MSDLVEAERIDWYQQLDKTRCQYIMKLQDECVELRKFRDLYPAKLGELLAATNRIEQLERELDENWNNYVSMAAQAKLRVKLLHAAVMNIAQSSVRPQTAAYELQQTARRALDEDLKLLVKK